MEQIKRATGIIRGFIDDESVTAKVVPPDMIANWRAMFAAINNNLTSRLEKNGQRVGILGRKRAGTSALINTLLSTDISTSSGDGQSRVIVSPENFVPGVSTTALPIEFVFRYTLH